MICPILLVRGFNLDGILSGSGIHFELPGMPSQLPLLFGRFLYRTMEPDLATAAFAPACPPFFSAILPVCFTTIPARLFVEVFAASIAELLPAMWIAPLTTAFPLVLTAVLAAALIAAFAATFAAVLAVVATTCVATLTPAVGAAAAIAITVVAISATSAAAQNAS